MEVRFTQVLVQAILSTNISQGSVATHLRCSKLLNYRFARNLEIYLYLFSLRIIMIMVLILGHGTSRFVYELAQPELTDSL